ALGQHERTAELTREELQLQPDVAQTYGNLAFAYIALNRLDEARGTIDQALARKMDVFNLRVARYHLEFLQNNSMAMKEQVDWARGKPCSEAWFLFLQSNTEAYHGRAQRARDLTRKAEDSAIRNDAAEPAASYEAYAAVRE